MKTNYSDLKFHLLLAETAFPPILTTPLLSFPSRPIFRAHFNPPISGLFRRWQEQRKYIYIYSVTQGDKFASPGAKSFLSNPAGHVVYHNAEFFKAYYKFFSLENRSVHFVFDKLFHIIIGHFDKIKCPIDPRRKHVDDEVNMYAT